VAAKPVGSRREGLRNAIVLFAQFRDEAPGWSRVPSWSRDLFNPDILGSLAHFYDTMSFGQFQIRGEIAPLLYESLQPASSYLAESSVGKGHYGKFNLEILEQADRDIDFSLFDNDGPDGMPNSGDDDGFVDAVFIMTASTPRNFLIGGATGIANLNLSDERIVDRSRIDGPSFVTDDVGIEGNPILIASRLGTLQQGRTFAEAAGSLCHEYGHILGLPDLYNTAFLRQEDAGPAEDGAGIGRWGLMGWGALGWKGDDGPNSLCAWSRLQLGWAEELGITQEVQEVQLEEVGKAGKVLKIRLSGQEHFLVEYRKRGANPYDRHIPDEGLLIWHVDPGLRELESYPFTYHLSSTVDLECADGRWQDAGFPLGSLEDASRGEDNLDFWAHDRSYSQGHAGNLGDATDLFDGVRFSEFTPETNPASYSNDGSRQMRIEDIAIRDGIAHMTVRVDPPRIEFEKIELVDENEDGRLVVGEEASVWIRPVNTGGLLARDVRVVVESDDPYVEILHPDSRFGDLDLGKGPVFGWINESGYPRLRFEDGFVGTHTAKLRADVFVDGNKMGSEEISVSAAAAQQMVEAFAVIDSASNGDGVAQPGEFIRLSLRLATDNADALGPLRFSLKSLDPRIRGIGAAQVSFSEFEDREVLSSSSPEFLLPADIDTGEELSFEFAVDTGWETWKDTLSIQVGKGEDSTPPRISLIGTHNTQEGLAILLSDRWIYEGGETGAARAVFYSSNMDRMAVVPLEWREGRYEGVWTEGKPGNYLVQAEVEDRAGNRGYSSLINTAIFPPGQSSGTAFASVGPWEELNLPDELRPAEVAAIAIAPSAPNVYYAASQTALWRSEDAGATWTRTGLMLNGFFVDIELSVDPRNPFTVYLKEFGHVLVSRDGGNEWNRINLPGPGVSLLGLDRLLSGRVYGRQGNNLFISEDQGNSWQEEELDGWVRSITTHPADLHSIYVLSKDFRSGSADNGATLWYSPDDGDTWIQKQQEQDFRELFPDPRTKEALYAMSAKAAWYSADRGSTWRQLDLVNLGGGARFSFHPHAPNLIYAWNPWSGQALWHSLDGGDTWESVKMPGRIGPVALCPNAHQEMLLTLDGRLHRGKEYGAILEEIELLEEDLMAGSIAFTPDGRIFSSSRAGYDTGSSEAGVFTRQNEGSLWEWQETPSRLPFFDVMHVDPSFSDVIIGHLSLGFNMYKRTTDGGNSWQPMSIAKGAGSGYGGDIRLFPPIVADPLHEGVYYLGDFQLFRSEDYGETWEKRGPFERNFTIGVGFQAIGGLALDPEYDGSIYTSLGDSIFHSDDAGETWTVLGRIQQGEGIFALDFHSANWNRMYGVTMGGFYLSEDKGITWSRTLEPAAGRWTSGRLRQNPIDGNRLFLVSSRELYTSGDGGFTWASLAPAFGGQPWFHDLSIDPVNPSQVYAATTWGVYRFEPDRITAVEEEAIFTPQALILDQNYPNPFNPQTAIVYQLPKRTRVKLVIYNMAGQRVKILVDKNQTEGRYQIVWDGTDDSGEAVGSGLYLYRLSTNDKVLVKRMVFVK